MFKIFLVSSVTVLALLMGNVFAEEGKKIQDNSFLIEEAYNQEPGVIQHIQTFQYMKDKTWGYSFTEEWPVGGMNHQFSFTIPVNHLNEDINKTSFGDVLINYRYQLINKGWLAMAPRLSLVIPTGDYKNSIGKGGYGVQINIPFSVELSEKWVTHLNLGTMYTPSSKEPSGKRATTCDFNSGISLIYFLSDNFNLMFEVIWNSNQSIQPDGTKKRESLLFINPGFRCAINFDSGLQIVPGIAFPVGLGASKGEYGAFVYLSFEHSIRGRS